MRSLLPAFALAGFLGAGACLAGDAPGAPAPPGPAAGAGAAMAAAGPRAGARVAVVAAGPRVGAAGAAAPDMRALIAEFASDNASVRDFYTIDRSPTRLAREDALNAAWLARLDALDVDALDAAGRIDWLLLRNEIRYADNHRAATRAKLTETAPLLPFAGEIAALEEARWHLAPVDPEAAATQLDALAKQIKALKERVEKGKGAKAAAADEAALSADASQRATTPDLAWFRKQQEPGGYWSCAAGGGSPQFDVSVTSLMLLSLMGSGKLHTVQGENHDMVLRALQYLLDVQQPDGGFATGSADKSTYDDVIATLALVQAWSLTHDDMLRAPAEKALKHLAAIRNPGKAWRYAAGAPAMAVQPNDMSVTGWAILAMAIARDTGLTYDVDAYRDALAYLDELTDPDTGITGYDRRGGRPSREGGTDAAWPADATESMTAVGVTCRLFDDPKLQKPGNAELVRKGVAVIARLPPLWDDAHRERRDFHFWFFGTTALYLAGGDAWKEWEKALIPAIMEHQERTGEFKGSWDPAADPWGSVGGRVYSTAMVAMTLEVFYRYETILGWHLNASDAAPPYPATAATGLATPQPAPAARASVDGAPATSEHTSASSAPSMASAASAEDPHTTDAPLSTTPVIAQRTARELNGLRRALDTWFAHYDEFSPGFSWWTRKPYDAAGAALDQYATLLREDIAGLKGKDEDPLVGDPIGRDALVDDLRSEMIDYSPEELLAIGEREFAWCETEMKKAAAEMGFGDDWKAALEKVKADHVAPGEQDRLVTDQSKEAIAFLDDHDLITIPDLCRETWRVRMIDANTQRTLPYAAYGGQDMLVAYPTRDMDQDTKLMTMRGNNVHFSRIVVPHELIPGHHLQGFAAARSSTQRDLFSTPFLVEGWALYWELRLWDLSWARSPEDRLGMLFWRMHRGARIIVSLKFHLGEMQPQEMIDFLVDKVGHEKAGATSEVRRYIGGSYGPLYQCAYMTGGLQLRALHDELVGTTVRHDDLASPGEGANSAETARTSDARAAPSQPGRTNPATGARWTEREFHDAVLAQGPIPVAMIRAALLSGGDAPPLGRDGPKPWRFAGDP